MADLLTTLPPGDPLAQRQFNDLLRQEGIQRDGNLDYTCGLFDESWNLVATGSCFGNTIRCLAVSKQRQGEGLLNRIVSHLMEVQAARGNLHLFLYDKCQNAKLFTELGFYEIARVDGQLVFMENRPQGFADYCAALEKTRLPVGRSAAIVMNANPFTLGHLHLVEQAAQENDAVHLFILSDETGPIPFAVRRQLVQEGVAHLPNVICHDSGSYLISSAAFPTYFLKDPDTVIRAHAALDLTLFGRLAACLGITRRYVGEESKRHVTALYNQVMAQGLPEYGVECRAIPCLTMGGEIVSARAVRQAIHTNRLEDIRLLVPGTTWNYFQSPKAAGVITAIQKARNMARD